jgi:hypothetical protein
LHAWGDRAALMAQFTVAIVDVIVAATVAVVVLIIMVVVAVVRR